MADEDILIKDLPTTEKVNDSDDIVIEDASPTTYRIKAGDLRSYITSEVAKEISELTSDISSLNSTLANKADSSDLPFKMYSSLGDIGLTTSSATSLLAITQAMNSTSILFIAVSSNMTSDFYSNGVIPVNATGTLEILYRSRARAIFTSDAGATYVSATSNGSITNFTSWSQL